MTMNPAKPRINRRQLVALGGAASLVSATSQSDAAIRPSGGALLDITLPPFDARGDGTTDDAPAIAAAVAALPREGGTIAFPGARAYRLGTTITDGGKAVRFEIGHTRIIGPPGGALFDLRSNGSSFVAAGPGATTLLMTPPDRAPQPPRLALSVVSGRVTGCSIVSAGSGLRSTPLIEVGASPSLDDAALIASVADGRIRDVAVVAWGAGYAVAPEIAMVGGGEAAIRISDVQHCLLRGFSIDMSAIPHAVGVLHRGGWYADIANVDVIETRRHPTAIALLIDSYTRGEPGPSGSFGGAYAGRYTNIVAKRTVVIGHDRSTATTLHFDTLDAATVHLHGVRGVLMTNPVLQGNAGAFLDLVNVDGVTLIGGDLEGDATVIRARGTCDNIRLAPLAYSAGGPLLHGAVGTGWRIDLARVNRREEPLYTGNAGSAGVAYQNSGWTEKHRQGLHYSGDSMVYSSNIKLVSATEGILDNPSTAGLALIMTASAQFILKYADAGPGTVPLRDIAQFDPGGARLPGLPAARPAAGSQRLWYDPADGNRVKYEP